MRDVDSSTVCAHVTPFHELFFFPQNSGQTQTIPAFHLQQSAREEKKKKASKAKHSAMTRNIRERRDQSADDNLRADLFFKLSNSGCALCHAVLSHTRRKRKRHESEAAASSAARLLLLFSRWRNNLEQK